MGLGMGMRRMIMMMQVVMVMVACGGRGGGGPWQFTQLQVQMDYLDSEQFPNIASTNPRSTKKSRWYLQHIHCHLHSAAVRGQSGHARRRCQPPTFGWFCHVWSKLGHRKNITTKCSEQDCYLQKDDVVVFKLASKRAKDIDQHCGAGRLQMCQCQEGLHETCLVGLLDPIRKGNWLNRHLTNTISTATKNLSPPKKKAGHHHRFCSRK